MNTFRVIKNENTKDKIYKISLDEKVSFKLVYCYNSISDTYMGTQIDCFVETIIGINNMMPKFFEDFDGYSPKESLLKMGFIEIEPTKSDLLLYKF